MSPFEKAAKNLQAAYMFLLVSGALMINARRRVEQAKRQHAGEVLDLAAANAALRAERDQAQEQVSFANAFEEQRGAGEPSDEPKGEPGSIQG
jgi:hypothetical protein